MPLIRRGAFVADEWSRAEAASRRIVPLGELEAVLVSATNAALGVDVPNNTPVATLAPYFDRLALIVIAFPKFADGRGFTLARRLRRAGFASELRASGHVLPDQLELAEACGIDSVEIPDELAARQPEPQWRAAQSAYSLGYQETADKPSSIFALRHGADGGSKWSE